MLGIAVGVGGTILAQEVLSEKSTPKPRAVNKTTTQKKKVKEAPKQVPQKNNSPASTIIANKRWLQNKSVDPISKRPLRPNQLIPNRALKDSIAEYKKKHHIQ